MLSSQIGFTDSSIELISGSMSENQPLNPELEREEVSFGDEESIRVLSWSDSMETPTIHDRNGSRKAAGGMGHKWHHHPELELTLVTAGSGVRWVGTSREPFTAPDLVLLGRSLPHTWELVGKTSGFAVQFRDAAHHAPLSNLPEFRAIHSLCQQSECGLLLPISVARRLSRHFRALPSAGGIERLSIFLRILAAIDEVPAEDLATLSTPVDASAVPARHAQSIRRAIHFLGDHFEDPITLEDVLADCQMTKATFSRHFPILTGQSFTEFLQTLRLERFRRLVGKRGRSITEAAFEAGFQNLSHFNKVFKKRYGETPREFLQAAR